MDLNPELIKAIGALWGVLQLVCLAYVREVKNRGDACCTKLAERDKADADALAAYRRQDQELIRLMQSPSARSPGAD